MELDLENIGKYLEQIDESALPAIKENLKIFVSLLSPDTPEHGLFMTANLQSQIEEGKIPNDFIQECINKHFCLNFGDTNPNDSLENVRSFEHQDRIMSFFDLKAINSAFNTAKIYIETSAGWDSTMIMLDSDY